MDTQAFQRWLAQVSQLSTKQKSALHHALQEPPVTEVLDSLPALQNCPHCQATAEHLGAGREACAVIVVGRVDVRALQCRTAALLACTIQSAGKATLKR